MSFCFGPGPGRSRCANPDIHKARRLPALILAILAGTGGPAAAQTTVLTLAEAEDLALAAEPGQLAMRARSASLEAQAAVAGSLPSPALRVGLNNFPIQSGGFSTEGMTNAGVAVRQAFPAGRSRRYDAARLNWEAAAMASRGEARGRDVRQSTRNAWLELYYWRQAQTLVSESRPLFQDLAEITRSLYSVGRKNQQDVFRAELELSRLDDRLIDIGRACAEAEARLAEWIGDAAARPLPVSIATLPAVRPLPQLEGSLSTHPLVLAADASLEASRSAVMLADEKSRPGWALDVAYSYREGTLASGQPRSDFLTVGVTVDMPFFRRRSVDSELTAALQGESAAESNREQVLRYLESELRAEHARWTELTRRLALFDERILGQSAANAEAAMLAYQSDTADFADVMRASIDDLNTRIDFVRLQVERAQSQAALANIGGL